MTTRSPTEAPPDQPSSSEESGRGNSGEGKDPPEGLYQSNKPESPDAGADRDAAPGKD